MRVCCFMSAVCMASLLVGCSQQAPKSKPQEAVVGKWQVLGGVDTVEFSTDGSVTFVTQGRAVTGKYTFERESVLKMAWDSPIPMEGFQQQGAYQHVKVSADELITNDPAGTSRKYKRVK